MSKRLRVILSDDEYEELLREPRPKQAGVGRAGLATREEVGTPLAAGERFGVDSGAGLFRQLLEVAGYEHVRHPLIGPAGELPSSCVARVVNDSEVDQCFVG